MLRGAVKQRIHDASAKRIPPKGIGLLSDKPTDKKLAFDMFAELRKRPGFGQTPNAAGFARMTNVARFETGSGCG